MKRFFALLTALVTVMTLFCACKKDKVPEDEYTGVLTKVRLGMPMKKIIALNSKSELYYESETVIWCVNNDTDLMEVKQRIPEGNQFFYADDSLITYSFKEDKSDQEYYLNSYLEELPCKLDRATAEKYYEDKKKMLMAKYNVKKDDARSTITGTEGVDQTLDNVTVMTLSSFEVTFTMQQTFDTVDGVEDYFGSYYSIEVKQLDNKTAVEVGEKKEK